MKRTVYIVDDHEAMREVLALWLDEEQDLAVCGAAETAGEALDAIPALNPELVLIDLSMPGMSGIELIEQLLARTPDLKALVLSGHTESIYAEQALEAGARGYILKGDPSAIMDGIRRVLGGDVYLSEEMRSARR